MRRYDYESDGSSHDGALAKLIKRTSVISLVLGCGSIVVAERGAWRSDSTTRPRPERGATNRAGRAHERATRRTRPCASTTWVAKWWQRSSRGKDIMISYQQGQRYYDFLP